MCQNNPNKILVYGKIILSNKNEMPLEVPQRLKKYPNSNTIKNKNSSYKIMVFPLQTVVKTENELSPNPCYNINPNLAVDSTLVDVKGNYRLFLAAGKYSIFVQIDTCFQIQDFYYEPTVKKTYINLMTISNSPVERNLMIKPAN